MRKYVGKNKYGIEVYETSDDVKKLSYQERMQRFVDIMENQYSGRTAKFTRNGHTYYARFEAGDIRKNVYGDKRSDKKGWRSKINVGADGNVFELVENATYERSETEKGKSTKAHKNIKYWDYFIKTVQIDNKVFDLVANVRKTTDNQYVYSLQLNENKKTIASPPLGTENSSLNRVLNATVNNSITENGENVNSETKFSLKKPVEETKDLIAVHNLPEEELKGNSIKKYDLFTQSVIDNFGITNLNDYIHVQRSVNNTLLNKGFFSDDGGRSKTVTNKNSGMVIEITPDGIKETFGKGNNYQKLGREMKINKLAAIEYLPYVLEHGILKNDNVINYHNPNSSVKYAYIESTVTINEKPAIVEVTIRKSLQKNKFWMHKVDIKQNIGSNPTGVQNSKMGYHTSDNDIISDSVEFVNNDLKNDTKYQFRRQESLERQNEKLRAINDRYSLSKSEKAARFNSIADKLITETGTTLERGEVSVALEDIYNTLSASDYSAAADYLKAYAIDTLIVSFLFCYIGYFNGCGKTNFVMVQGIVGAFLVRIPVSYFVSKAANVTLFKIGLATPASTVVQIVLCTAFYIYVLKKEKMSI